jgi:hypothetical protein
VEDQAPVLFVRILVEVVDAAGVEGRRAPDHAVHFVAFVEKELREVGAVLTGDAGDQRTFRRHAGILARHAVAGTP